VTEPTAVLFMTHRWDPIYHLKFRRLQREIGDRADVFALVDRSPKVMRDLRRWPPGQSVVLFETAQLAAQLGYPLFGGDSLADGSTHFPVLLFALRQPRYQRFLVMEYDVDYSGNWGDLLDDASAGGTEYAAFHFLSQAADPGWFHWPTVEPAESDRAWASNPGNLIHSFNPLYFITRRALELVHNATRKGWHAHFEALLPTVLTHAGCRIVNLAAYDRFCVGWLQHASDDTPVEALSTFRFHPEVTPREFVARSTGRTMFHPIKQPWCYDGARIRGLRQRADAP
jgi:hypothetical protein